VLSSCVGGPQHRQQRAQHPPRPRPTHAARQSKNSAGNRACTHGTRRHGAALSMSAHHQVVSVLLTVLLGLPAVAAREPQLPLPAAPGNPQSAERGPLPGPPGPLRLRPAMLADNTVGLAGRDVVILNARVVGVFEPHALLIEPAVRYLEPMRFRTRLLVLM